MAAASAPLRDLVTLVVVPKDWYSHAVEGLWALLEGNPGVRVLYCLSPPHPAALDAALVAARARHPTVEVLLSPALAEPYAMRQAAADRVTTRYYVVLGNDTWGDDTWGVNGWLARLVATAEAEPGAAVVQPLILERSVTHNDTLHVWWNPLQLLTGGTDDLLSTSFDNRMVRLGRHALQRELLPGRKLGFVEDHALLVRSSAFPPGHPPLWDPRASARREFFDLAWTVAAAGFDAVLEPRAVVTYRKARPLAPSDLALFVARRHDEACVRSLLYLERKWRVRTRLDRWHESHRDEALTGTRFWAGGAAGEISEREVPEGVVPEGEVPEGKAPEGEIPEGGADRLRLVVCLLALIGFNRFSMGMGPGMVDGAQLQGGGADRCRAAPGRRATARRQGAGGGAKIGRRDNAGCKAGSGGKEGAGGTAALGGSGGGRSGLRTAAPGASCETRAGEVRKGACETGELFVVEALRAVEAMGGEAGVLVLMLEARQERGAMAGRASGAEGLCVAEAAIPDEEASGAIPEGDNASGASRPPPLSSLGASVVLVTAAAAGEVEAERHRLSQLSVDPFVSYLLLRIRTVRPGPLRLALLPLASAAFAVEEGALELWLWLRESAGVGGAVRRRLGGLCASHGAALAGVWDESCAASLSMPWPPPLVGWAYRPLRVDELLHAMARLGGAPPRRAWVRTPASRATLTLCSPSAVPLPLEFLVHETPVARRWLAQLRVVERRRIGVKYPDRLYGFPHDPRTPCTVSLQVRQAAAVLNTWREGVVPDHLLGRRRVHVAEAFDGWATATGPLGGEGNGCRECVVPDHPLELDEVHVAKAFDDGDTGWLGGGYGQAELNQLHKVFEDLRGSIESPAPFFASAPPRVREALEELNLHIHRMEDLHRQAQRRARGQPATPRLTVAFEHTRPRVPLRDRDLQHFTVRMRFGTLYLNYCVVGKHLLELWQDDDDECGEANVRPQRMMSADAQAFFGPSMSDEEASLRLADFFDWLRADPDRRQRWAGKELCLGRIPVASLDRRCAAVRGLSDEQVVELIGRHQRICSMTAARRWW